MKSIQTGILAVLLVLSGLQTYMIWDMKSSGSSAKAEKPKANVQANNNPNMNATATDPMVTATDPTHDHNAEPEIPAGPKTEISFAKSKHDFGTIKQNTENEHIFKFTNTGGEPLIISNAKGSCGCTVPEYPREPIAPGEQGEIKVVYSPGKQKGKQNKTVTLTANTEPAQTILNISAEVEEVAE